MIIELCDRTLGKAENETGTNEFRIGLLDAVSAAEKRVKGIGAELPVRRITLEFDLEAGILTVWFDRKHGFSSSLYDTKKLGEDVEWELRHLIKDEDNQG